MRTWEQCADLTAQLMNEQEPIVALMREVNTRYRGDYVIPFPDLSTEPELPPLTPMLVGEAVDQLGMRAAQVSPTITVPAMNNDKATGKGSRQYARIRHNALHAAYRSSMWDLQRSRAFRHLVAYNTTSLVVLPDFRQNLPTLQVRDPLSTFAEKVDENTPRPPEYASFVTRHSGEWIRKCYPSACGEYGGPIAKTGTHRQWEIAEWVDCDQIIWFLLGPVDSTGDHVADEWARSNVKPRMVLAGPFPNMAGMPLAVVPRQVTLSGMASRIGNLLGLVDLQAKLQGLSILAQQKAIFPDVYAIGDTNGNPTIVGGRWKDGTEGEINLLQDVSAVGTLRTTPDPATQQTIDTMERAFRTSTGLSPMFGGESYGALRTGRAIDAMTNMSVDPRIRELHLVMSSWQPHVNAAILATWQGMWPGRKYTLFTGLPGDQSVVELEPYKHIETVESDVRYPFPGADVTQQTQILGSLLGTKAISRRTFRNEHPWVGDPEGETEYVRSEELEEALIESVKMQIQQGALPLPALAMLHAKLEIGMPIMKAITEMQREMQELQAQQAPPPEEGQIAAPEEMPGMAGGPGALQQAPAPEAQMIQTQPDVGRMRELMSQMAGR
jgi:hypothetical protein